MRKYEVNFIVRPDADEETLKATREKVKSVITENGGEILEEQDMGKRRLAYMIDKYREGIYTVYTFKANPDLVSELDRVININDNIIRHLTINLEEK
ncbi:30S ribosomal protein S6 [Thermoflavimicrobium dichotomicum]|uniref:Small ribosomal subunit protein bS6 n=1 Tax=Thermoflavimicrobium dichotomicum TaxID=46223 RepID=A0A1I3KBA6_9BACL|nr:30S ribosomal protein S6 [Thermoflavimicrobium dichotomicum]SFI69801.1 small subunit ribosomal protein S6 [Thermoflavimicrobium dichotomicum]